MLSKPQPTSPRREADEPDDLREEIAVLNERDKVREQREAARPAGEVVEQLLRRHPAS